MQITPTQLNMNINNALSSLYLISGDELLLTQETRNCIIAAAKLKGFSEKEIYHIESGFQIEALIESCQTQSLFYDKKLFDIRNINAKFDTAFFDFIKKNFEHAVADRLLIISTGKLTAAQQKSTWCEWIKKHGVFIPVWPIKSHELPQWIINRGKQYQLTISNNIALRLAHFTEGSLLGTQQALEKLHMLYPGANITHEQLRSVLCDHARFTVFDLENAMAQKNIQKITRIMARLEQIDEEPTLVLWAICRKLREQNAIQALQQAAYADEIIKGARTGNVWQELLKTVISDQ